ncbi:hypothetical protein, partial [Bilophila wadsworthia]|uniref:hypothetical protein n=1 Tax=Bilophila wadsworthia TaxID=35833 RepID=UPI0030810692
RFLKKAPSPVPPPSKTSTGGEAARQESHLLEKGKELFSEIFPSAVRFVQRCPTRIFIFPEARKAPGISPGAFLVS